MPLAICRRSPTRSAARSRNCTQRGDRMPLLERKRHSLHYETYGDRRNPAVLLIMGLGVSSRAWQRLPQGLASRFFVVTFDNRGTGRSARHGFACRMRALADDAALVLDMRRVAQAHVFGISMGGMIAQE